MPKNLFFRIITSVLIIFITPFPALSGNYAGEFLQIGGGARALGMGGAFIALANDATAGYWNPAGLSQIKKRALSFMHAERLSGLETYDFVGYGHNLKSIGSIAFTFIRLGISDIPRFPELKGSHEQRISNVSLRPSPTPIGYFDDQENAVFLSYGKNLPAEIDLLYARTPVDLSLGASVKYIRQNLGDAYANGWGVDCGISLIIDLREMLEQEMGGKFILAAVVQDILRGTHLKWNTGHEDIISDNLKIGWAYVHSTRRFHQIALSIDVDFRNDDTLCAGIEYQFMNTLSLRAGLRNTDIAAGAGIAISSFFAVDYAFTTFELANAHQMSVLCRF